MKRVLTFLAVMLLPLSVMAMTPVSDSTLSGVTGQAGVNINANLTMNIEIGTMAWGDNDGVAYNSTTATTVSYGQIKKTNGGFVGVNGFNIQNLQIRARTESTDNYGGYSAFSSNPLEAGGRLKPITIDVAQDATSALNGGKVFVRIGLGSLQISMNDLDMEVALGDYATEPTLDEILGTVYIQGMNMYISPKSYVDIFAHGACGVTMNLNVIIDKFALTAVSWGDTDGLGSTSTAIPTGAGTGPVTKYWANNTTAGYVGLTDIYLGAITIKGQLAIDVATVTDEATSVYLEHYRESIAVGLYSDFAGGTTAALVPNFAAALNYAKTQLVPSLAIVRITFGDGAGTPFYFGIDGFFRATVRLSADKDLVQYGTLPVIGLYPVKGDTLGDIYLSAFKVNIKDGSWVDIWAH